MGVIRYLPNLETDDEAHLPILETACQGYTNRQKPKKLRIREVPCTAD